MDLSDFTILAEALGSEDAAAVERFLDGKPLSLLIETAQAAEGDWVDWGRAAAVLQRWLETKSRTADAERKLGYIHCTSELQKKVPPSMRFSLAKAVAGMLECHGFAE